MRRFSRRKASSSLNAGSMPTLVRTYVPSEHSTRVTVFSTFLLVFVPPSLRVSFWCLAPTSSTDMRAQLIALAEGGVRGAMSST